MEDAVPMHVFNRFQKLINVELYSRLRKVVCAAFDGLIEVHLHEFEDQCESARWLITTQKEYMNLLRDGQVPDLQSTKSSLFPTKEIYLLQDLYQLNDVWMR